MRPAEREALIEALAPTIRYLAERLWERLPEQTTVALDDLLQAGAEGLLDALDRFDPRRDCSLKVYAEHRIQGAMKDFLRAVDPVPRSVRDKLRALEEAYRGLEQALQRAPAEEEVAQALGLSLDTFARWLRDCRGVRLCPLDPSRPAPEDGLAGLLPGHEPTPEQAYAAQERRDRLAAACDALPDQQRVVLSLYYHAELTLKEIGRVLELSESRVCQIHTTAILRLRARLHASREELVA
jgi:RNA polymerase sigma factor for flagellar operon FliA